MAPRDSQEGLLFDVQRFSLHDGPGIRTTLFFKGCPLRCRWCQNPESHTPAPEMAFYRERCEGCFRCEAVCPEQAITRRPEARIDFSRCSACGACTAVCRQLAIVTIGCAWPVDRLVAELVQDRDFYEDSGGGVTLSGGEPMGQHAYLARLLPRLKAEGLHVALETCGMFAWKQIESLLPHLDLIYFDLKHMAPDTHKALTGMDNALIQENFKRLTPRFAHLRARMPLVPGMNDDEANLRATARFLRENRHERIHCLPYHNLGEAKLARLHTDLKPLNACRMTSERLDWVRDIFTREGIHAVVYD
jgi:pyruvate formate lyase activating enzyme